MSDRDEEIQAAERRGAREALTRLAEEHRRDMRNIAAEIAEKQRDTWYPAQRVRAAMPLGDEGGEKDATSYVLKGPHVDLLAGNVFRWSFPRADLPALLALSQRADAEGFVGAEEGLGDRDPEKRGGAADTSVVADASSPAPTPALREWYANLYDGEQTVFAYPTPDQADAAASRRRLERVHVREVRPLTAAQVEALAQAMADAWDAAVGLSPEKLYGQRRANFLNEARAALRHLGIPYEEA